MAIFSRKEEIPKESINTQKVTNASTFISQSKPSEPMEIMVGDKMRTGVSILSGGTGASVTPKKTHSKK